MAVADEHQLGQSSIVRVAELVDPERLAGVHIAGRVEPGIPRAADRLLLQP